MNQSSQAELVIYSSLISFESFCSKEYTNVFKLNKDAFSFTRYN